MAPKLSAAARARARLVPLTLIDRPQQCVAYGRVSSDQQREAETINSQKTILLKDITSRDDPTLAVADQRKLIAEFWDDGVSGTIPLEQRPDGRRLVALVCGRGDVRCDGSCSNPAVVDVVWITRLDRLARKLQILIAIEAFLRAHGVALRCLEFNIDTSNAMGKLIFTILGAIAEWEREIILDRTIKGRKQKASEGKFVGGRRPLGFNVDEDGHLAVDETLIGQTGEMAYRIVQKIFENVALHGSTAGREALRFGLSERRVGIMLHNPRYKGEGGMLADGEWIPATQNNPPQLVSPEIWDLVQVALKDNRKNSARNRRYDYLLSQLLMCCEVHDHVPAYDIDGHKAGRNPKTPGFCGRTFIGRTAKQGPPGRIYAYYYCTRRTGCTAKVLRAADVENAIWTDASSMLRDPQRYMAKVLARRDQTEIVHDLRAELTVVVDQITRVESERLNVLRNHEKGHYTDAQRDTRMAELDEALEGLKTHQSTLEIQLRSVTLSQAGLQRVSMIAGNIDVALVDKLCASANPAEVSKGRQAKAAILHSLLERIEVRTGTDGTTKLRLCYRFGEAALAMTEDNRHKVSIERRSSQEASCTEQRFVVDIELASRFAA